MLGPMRFNVCPGSSGACNCRFLTTMPGLLKRRVFPQRPGIGDFSEKGRRRGCLRAYQVNLIGFGAAAAGKVPGKGAQTVGVRGGGLSHADASQATGLVDPGAGLNQGQETAGTGDVFQNLRSRG